MSQATVMIALSVCAASAACAERESFDDTKPGALPPGWTAVSRESFDDFAYGEAQ